MARWIASIAACVVLISATNVDAAVITQPTSLNPGDEYRLAFVTSGSLIATSANIADYNTFVTNAANAVTALADLGTTWTAIASTAIASTTTVHARDNTNTVPSTVTGGSLGVPIFILNDVKIADSNDDLWDGTLDEALQITENGITEASVNPWTGTTDSGTGEPGLQLGQATAMIGSDTQTTSDWINETTLATSNNKPLYAISGILTAVPEPSTLALTVLGLLSLSFIGWRRRRAT